MQVKNARDLQFKPFSARRKWLEHGNFNSVLLGPIPQKEVNPMAGKPEETIKQINIPPNSIDTASDYLICLRDCYCKCIGAYNILKIPVFLGYYAGKLYRLGVTWWSWLKN
jgi:hypothetical protein